ncbi:MAG: HAMP domain-containing histidine kinase [Bdellovibrionales bacterium]|nr:HAMP domain-containing histidine kinase [Bdellovibrionales bacterium]
MLEKTVDTRFDEKLNDEYRRRTAIGILPGILVVSTTWFIFFNSIASFWWKVSGLMILSALMARALIDRVLYRGQKADALYYKSIKTLSVLTAVGWGCACFFVIKEHGIISIESLTIMMVNVANASAVSYAMSPIGWLRKTYLIVSLFPLSIAVFITADSWRHSMYGVITLVFINYLLSLSSKQKSNLVLSYELNDQIEANTLRLENERENLKKALKQLKETQDDLMNERAKTLNSERLTFLGSMASGVAHEINNPLTISGGQVYRIESLLAGELSENNVKKIKGFLEKITDMNGRIRSIVRGLQYFSRDRKIEPPEVFPLPELMELNSQFFKERLKNNGIEFSVQTPPEVYIHGKKNELSESLFNLVENSIEAVQSVPQPSISIISEVIDNHLEISVVDNGKGVNSTIKDQIFDPFFTTKDVGQGTGLGLSIARGIAQSHGGSLSFTSAPGQTIFVLQLPIVERPSSP